MKEKVNCKVSDRANYSMFGMEWNESIADSHHLWLLMYTMYCVHYLHTHHLQSRCTESKKDKKLKKWNKERKERKKKGKMKGKKGSSSIISYRFTGKHIESKYVELWKCYKICQNYQLNMLKLPWLLSTEWDLTMYSLSLFVLNYFFVWVFCSVCVVMATVAVCCDCEWIKWYWWMTECEHHCLHWVWMYVDIRTSNVE